MFKLESYITPLLMGYLDKYVKLRQEDFQLSLWGGDAVLNNLDLRLDELEKVVQLPVMFQSGHIHELRLHVPWTKLGSEPVVITINTVECIVKVRDTAYETASSGKSASSPGKSSQQRQRSKRRSQPTEDLPPGYLQSLVSRIVNNVTFVINNLILKFVEDDIVLSVNVKSAECYSVDKEWNRAFVELTPDDLALRKMINFADLTVCLDKTNASGHIESYQEPMAYRCAVTCRFHMEYDSVTAKFPRASRFNLYCDVLHLSLTDTQLPMFVRLVQLCIAMYYGLLDIPAPASPISSSVDPITTVAAGKDGQGGDDELVNDSEAALGEPGEDQGWASWAWSYVPQIMPLDDEEEDSEDGQPREGRSRREKAAPLVLSLGFYIHKGAILFKLTEKSRDSSELPHRKMQFHPFLHLNIEGVGIELLIQGLEFFSAQVGFTCFKLATCGECICGVEDEKVERCNTLLSGGEPLDQKIGLDYLSNSLFDDMSWENRGQRSQHIVDSEHHREVFTEQYALQRFAAFWLDLLYTMDKPDNTWSSASSEANSDDSVFMKEYSTLRMLFGHTKLQFTSTFYHRISKLLACAAKHQYQPYGGGRSSDQSTQEERPLPSEEQVKSLEDFIPTNITHLMLINPTVTIITAEHDYCDVAKKNFKTRDKKKKKKRETSGTTGSSTHQSTQQKQPQKSSSAPSSSLPALTFTASRFDLQVTRPMYPGRLVKLVTAIAGPSSNLLHHCHSHTQIKLFSLQAGLQRCEADGSMSQTLTLLPPCSFALYSRSLQLPKLWTNSSLSLGEWMYEVPNASINVSKASILMVCRVASSWLSPASPSSMYAEQSRDASGGGDSLHCNHHLLGDSLLDDLFPVSGENTHQTFPLLEVGLCSLEFKSCTSRLVSAWSGGLSSVHVLLYTPGIGGKMSAIPLLYGPNDTSSISDSNFFLKSTLDVSNMRSDCVTATVQIPKQSGISEAQALVLIDCQGICAWLDPGLVSWFHYCPQPRPRHKNAEQPTVTLDLSLAQMTSPLNNVSQASVHSTSSQSRTAGHSMGQASTSHHHQQSAALSSPRKPSVEKSGAGEKTSSAGQTLAEWFPFIRLLHIQVDIKPSAIFLPKTSVPAFEASPDILTLVHQAKVQGRLSDTLVICVPGVSVSSTMTKPLSVVQDLPVTSIHGSLIGEKLPWTVKMKSMCAYVLHSSSLQPSFLMQPLDIVSTVAVTCKYNPPTSEVISSLAFCLHVDVGPPRMDVTATQLHLCSTAVSMASSVCNNSLSLLAECSKHFASKKALSKSSDREETEKTGVTAITSQTVQCDTSLRTGRKESVRSEMTETNPTTDISEDFSHEGSPLHESLIDEPDGASQGIKLSLWLQLMVPSVTASVYSVCPLSGIEHGLSLVLDHLDVSLDSQQVYTKVKLSLASLGLQHSTKNSQTGQWLSWTDPEGIVMSCRQRQLPRHLSMVTARLWQSDTHRISGGGGGSFLHHHHTLGGASTQGLSASASSANKRSNSSSAVSVTFTRALCKNVKRRLRKSNVELPTVSELDIDQEAMPSTVSGDGYRIDDLDLYFYEYLSEICIKTEPIDLVLKPELVSAFSNISGSDGASSRSRVRGKSGQLGSLDDNFEELRAQKLRRKSSQAGKTNSASLPIIPLIYADFGTVRVFLPKSENKLNIKVNKPKHSLAKEESTVIDIESVIEETRESTYPLTDSMKAPAADGEVCSTINHTMVVLQVNSCMVQPHAENPLPRVAVEKDLYQRAVQSGMTQQPGSVVEDRQYQLNVRGVALSSGVWHQLVNEAREEERQKSPTGSQVQIPALEWNTFLMDSAAQDKREVKLIPLATPFDVCVVIAPPISYISQSKDNPISPLLVCGLTSEMNVTSDLDLYVSSCQLKLLAETLSQFGGTAGGNGGASDREKSVDGLKKRNIVTEMEHKSLENAARGLDTERAGAVAGGVDSGVESDLSALTFDKQRVGAAAVSAGAGLSSSNPPAQDNVRAGGVVDQSGLPEDVVLDRLHRKAGGNAVGNEAVDDDDVVKGSPDLLTGLPPLDVLLTAGRISCTIYTHKILSEDVSIQIPLFGDHQLSPHTGVVSAQGEGHHGHGSPSSRRGSVKDNLASFLSRSPALSGKGGKTDDEDEGINRSDEEGETEDGEMEEETLDGGFTSFNFMKPQQSDITNSGKIIPAGSVAVVPFVYLYIMQPHCILANHHHHGQPQQQPQPSGIADHLISEGKGERKVEVSCYDILIKGASDRHISAVDEYHVMPVCADFNVHWLETRPGDPHPHTGIPPSLMTAILVQQPYLPGVIKLDIGRPVRLKASQLAVEQISEFVGDLVSTFSSQTSRGGRHRGSGTHGDGRSSSTGKSFDMSTIAERLEVTTAQLVVSIDLDSDDCGRDTNTSGSEGDTPVSVGAVLSVEGVNLQAQITSALSDEHISVEASLQLRDGVAKTSYNRQRHRHLVGPVTLDLHAGLSWVCVSSDLSIPQVVLSVAGSGVRLTFGQEHVFCFTEMTNHINQLIKKMLSSKHKPSKSDSDSDEVRTATNDSTAPDREGKTPAAPFVVDRSQDDLRSGNFHFIENSADQSVQPEPYEVVCCDADSATGEGSSMIWCYPHPRVLTSVVLNPVPFCLSTTSRVTAAVPASIPCQLQYWSGSTGQFSVLASAHISESEVVMVTLPDPERPGSRADLVAAKMWRLVLGASTTSESPAVLPASLAACTRVDSAMVPSLVPFLEVSLCLPAVELHACHHLQYNGSRIPEKLNMYQICPGLVDDQTFAVVSLRKIMGSLTRLSASPEQSLRVKMSGEASLSVLEYGHLTMEDVLEPSSFSVSVTLDDVGKTQSISVYTKSDKMKVRVSRSIIHSLHMAAAAWSTLSPACRGPHLIFNHLIVCNDTASSIRFGQSGTTENILLNSREMIGYSWRSEHCAQLLQVCMDTPSWKWTEPFPVGISSGSKMDAASELAGKTPPRVIVRTVTAADQSWAVLVRVKRLSALQTQVIICGQLLVSNRLSQPISMRLCGSQSGKTLLAGHASTLQHRLLTIQPGSCLPSLVENEVMVNPVQFRLAGQHTSWSHDIFLSGDKMKDNQMVKIPLPDKTSYFHIWCRVFCQHFTATPQKLPNPIRLYNRQHWYEAKDKHSNLPLWTRYRVVRDWYQKFGSTPEVVERLPLIDTKYNPLHLFSIKTTQYVEPVSKS